MTPHSRCRPSQALVLLAAWSLAIRAAAGPWAFGPQRTAVFLVDYQPATPEVHARFLRRDFFESPNSFAAYVREVSYGQADLAGDVYGWYGFPPDQLSYGIWPDKMQVMNAARAEVPDFTMFDKMIYVMADVAAPSLGASSFGPIQVNTPDGPIQATESTIWRNFFQDPHDGMSFTPNPTVAHELMHTFGVEGHANVLDCGDRFIGMEPAAQVFVSYADPFDIMGGHWWGGHPNAAFKRRIGWLSEDQEIIATDSGLHTIFPLETAGPEPRLITLPLPKPIPLINGTTIQEYYVETRLPIGFDEGLSQLAGFDFAPLQAVNPAGVLIRGGQLDEDGLVSHTYLLDATPNSRPGVYGYNSDFIDAFLAPGGSVTDPYNGIRITAGIPQPDGGIPVEIKRLPDLEITQAVITIVPNSSFNRARLTVRNRLPWNPVRLPAGARYVYVATEPMIWDAAAGEYRRPRVKPTWNSIAAITGAALTSLLNNGEATWTISVPKSVNGSFNAHIFMIDPQGSDFYADGGPIEETDEGNNRLTVRIQ